MSPTLFSHLSVTLRTALPTAPGSATASSAPQAAKATAATGCSPSHSGSSMDCSTSPARRCSAMASIPLPQLRPLGDPVVPPTPQTQREAGQAGGDTAAHVLVRFEPGTDHAQLLRTRLSMRSARWTRESNALVREKASCSSLRFGSSNPPAHIPPFRRCKVPVPRVWRDASGIRRTGVGCLPETQPSSHASEWPRPDRTMDETCSSPTAELRPAVQSSFGGRMILWPTHGEQSP